MMSEYYLVISQIIKLYSANKIVQRPPVSKICVTYRSTKLLTADVLDDAIAKIIIWERHKINTQMVSS